MTKVLHVNQFDSGNGASWAMNRLHHALLKVGCDSRMWVQRAFYEKEKVFSDSGLMPRLRPHLESLYKIPIGQRSNYLYSTSYLPRRKAPWDWLEEVDIIHLHWINGGFVPLSFLLQLQKPIVWTFHDIWPLAGLRHYPKIRKKSDSYLLSDNWDESMLENKLDERVFAQKKEVFEALNLSAITPSSWMKFLVKGSSLWKGREVTQIVNTIDSQLFVAGDKDAARRALGISSSRPLILFGAVGALSDERKGLLLLEKIIRCIKVRGYPVELLIFGNSDSRKGINVPFNVHYLGHIHDQQKLAQVYQAADVMMVPSVQDNFPNTVVEALCTALPVVAYRMGGMEDLIVPGKTGGLVAPFSVNLFVDELDRWLRQQYQVDMNEVERFRQEVSPKIVAKNHLKFYQKVLLNSES